MLDEMVKFAKAGVVVFWVAVMLSLVSVIPATYGQPIIWIGTFVLFIHMIEYLYVRAKYDGKLGPEFSFVGTLLFGLTHWLPTLVGNGETRDDR